MSTPGDLGVSGIGQSVGREVAALDQCDPQATMPFKLDGAEDTHDTGADDHHIKLLAPRLRHIGLAYKHGPSSCGSDDGHLGRDMTFAARGRVNIYDKLRDVR
jgi:hypothetical protein